MSALSDWDIKSFLGKTNGIHIEPFVDSQLQPASYDVRLGGGLYFYTGAGVLDTREDPSGLMDFTTIPESGWTMAPGQFCIGETVESIRVGSQFRAKFEGKSSLGRLGLSTHITAGFIDPGYHGNLTLELKNETHLPFRLWPGMKIGQIAFELMASPSERPYGHKDLGSKYQDSIGVVPSRAWLEASH